MDKSKNLQMIELVKKFHAEQTRNNGRVPYWRHCLNVAEIVKRALETTGDIPNSNPRYATIYLAALGHDLYEDTSIQPQEITSLFGAEVDRLIVELTNRQGDDDRREYIAQMVAASEEARLIKYADMIDNSTSSAYGIQDNGVEWTRTFLQPILTEMQRAMDLTSFVRYQRTAEYLRTLLRFTMELLQDHIYQFDAHH